MKKLAFPILVIFSLLIIFISCSNKGNKSRKPVSLITVQPQKASYVRGEKISVQVITKLKNGEIENIQLFQNNELVTETRELNFTVNDITINKIGNITFKVVATKTDGKSNTRSKSIKVISSKVPVKYSYRVINSFPHLTTSYTQGLEFHNGKLFEGTGEYGKSHLYQINVNTGNPVKSLKIDDKYFGEGITILGDKIYQLTYHAQKGFVYDLNTFSLIDSFQYASKEGWGLTNDGKHLIMSDGTNQLIWLDPDNFLTVKKLQVANNIGFMGFLNELEYVDGKIYANIYTTNTIVLIDEKTGEIIEEINMAGIIDLYNISDNSIDYLNGIAYNSQNGHFYITGKLWPRIFEVTFVPSK